jgi:hypothetical protein
LIRAFISYQNIQEKSIILENGLKIWPKSQAEALATELPIKKKCVMTASLQERITGYRVTEQAHQVIYNSISI